MISFVIGCILAFVALAALGTAAYYKGSKSSYADDNKTIAKWVCSIATALSVIALGSTGRWPWEAAS